MGFFLPSDDSNEYNGDDGIATSARGGGTAPATSPMLPSYAMGHPVLDVSSRVLNVGRVDILGFSDFVVGRLAGGHHHFLWRRQQRGGGRGVGGMGGDGEFMGVCC